MQQGKYRSQDSTNLFNTFSAIFLGHQSSSSVPFVAAKMTSDLTVNRWVCFRRQSMKRVAEG